MKHLIIILGWTIISLAMISAVPGEALAQCRGCHDGVCLLGCGTDGSTCGACNDDNGVCAVLGDCNETMTMLVAPDGTLNLEEAEANTILNVETSRSDLASFASYSESPVPAAATFRRRQCDGAIVERLYSSMYASKLRKSSKTITL